MKLQNLNLKNIFFSTVLAFIFSLLFLSCNKPRSVTVTRAPAPVKKAGDQLNKPAAQLPPVSDLIQKSAVEYSMAATLNFIEAKCLDSACSVKTVNTSKTAYDFTAPKILIDKINALNIKANDPISLFYKTTKDVTAIIYSAVGFRIQNSVYYLSNIRSTAQLINLDTDGGIKDVFTDGLENTSIDEPQVLEAKASEFYISGVGTEAGDKIQISVTDSANAVQQITIGKALINTLVDRDPYLERKMKFSIIYDDKNIIGFCIRNFKSVVF